MFSECDRFTTFLRRCNVRGKILTSSVFLPHLRTPVGGPMTPSLALSDLSRHYRCQSMQVDWYLVNVIVFTTFLRRGNVRGKILISSGFLPHLRTPVGGPMTPSLAFSDLSRHFRCQSMQVDWYLVNVNVFTTFLRRCNVGGKILISSGFLLHLRTPVGDPMTPALAFFALSRHYRCQSMQADWYLVTVILLATFPLSNKITGQSGGFLRIFASFVHPHVRPLDPLWIFFWPKPSLLMS